MFLLILSFLIGLIQGITELLPISSSAHLSFFLSFITTNDINNIIIDITHLGSAFGLIIFYRKTFFCISSILRLINISVKMLLYVLPLIITVITIDIIQYYTQITIYSRHFNVYAFFIIGILLILYSHDNPNTQIKTVFTIPYHHVFIMGIMQIAAIIPGASRLATALITTKLLGYNNKTSVDISLFFAIPSIICSLGRKIIVPSDLLYMINSTSVHIYLISFLTTVVITVCIAKLITEYISQNGFSIFGYYRVIISTIIITYHII